MGYEQCAVCVWPISTVLCLDRQGENIVCRPAASSALSPSLISSCSCFSPLSSVTEVRTGESVGILLRRGRKLKDSQPTDIGDVPTYDESSRWLRTKQPRPSAWSDLAHHGCAGRWPRWIGASLAFFGMRSGSAGSALLQIVSSACGSAGVANARSNLLYWCFL
jgi:hypothetical protein